MQENINIPDSTITTNLSFRNLVLMNMQQLTNFPYIEKDFDALTDYELLCLVVKFLNDVIANQNEQNDSITRMYESFLALQNYVNNTKDELEDAFNNLDDYVRNYFDNLDVQEEINNKLDKMLEDGVLEQIIEQFLQLTSLICFDNVSSMKNSVNIANGSYAKTLGYYSKGDGGSALYKIRTITNDDVVDEMTILEITNDNTLVAELIIENNELNINQLGAKNDGVSDNKAYIEKAINLSINKKIIIKLMGGDYCYSGVISIPENQNGFTLIGSNEFTTKIKTLNDNSQLNFTNFLRCKIENIRFIGTGTEVVPIISLPGVCHLSEFYNCTFATNMGVNIGTAAYLKFEDCSFSRQTELSASSNVNYLVKTSIDASEYLYFMNCYFEGASSTDECSPVQILGGHEIYFDNCDFCNWYGGNALQLGGRSSLKHVHISNSTFVRNKKSILCKTNFGITDVTLNNIGVYLLNGDEERIIEATRDDGSTGVLSDIHGNITIDSNYALREKTMFFANSDIQGGNIKVYSNGNLFPKASYYFIPCYQPIMNFFAKRTISGSSSTVSVKLSEHSPFHTINLPDVKTEVLNGAGPTNITVNNTFDGNLELVMTFASSTPYCEMYIALKY